MKTIQPTIYHARKVLASIDGELRHGAGDGEGQNVCVMQAIARALGLPATNDHALECVGDAVSAFNRRLNDCEWSTAAARAEGMKKLGIASLGSNQLDQMQFGKLIFLRGVQKLLPFVFRKIAKNLDVKETADKYRANADICERSETFEDAQRAVQIASAYASAYAYASTYASSYAYAAAVATHATKQFGDALLRMKADIAVECLVELKSPGVKWLKLCKSTGAAK